MSVVLYIYKLIFIIFQFSNVNINLYFCSFYMTEQKLITLINFGETERDIMKNYKHNCKSRLISNLNPAIQYQTQKLIQKTCRVSSSLYTTNLAAVSTFQHPSSKYIPIKQNGAVYIAPPKVNWNQMSDRSKPANYSKQNITNTAGVGVGVDIKHNSYNRYLNRLKGKGPVKRGIIPPNYGTPIPFNNAYPIRGGKVVKTGIINGSSCVCPNSNNDIKYIANEVYSYNILNTIIDNDINYEDLLYVPNVGDVVWVLPDLKSTKELKGIVLSIDLKTYTSTVKLTQTNLILYSIPLAFLSKYDSNCKIIYASPESLLSQDSLVDPLTGSINKIPLCSIISQTNSRLFNKH